METQVKTCTCKHRYQDRKYGAGRRLHNRSMKGWGCTVCGATKAKSSSERAKENKDKK